MTNQKTTPIQFDFTPEATARLNELRAQLGAKDGAEVLHRALRQYDYLVTKYGPDAEIIIESGGKRDVIRLGAALAEVIPFPKLPKC